MRRIIAVLVVFVILAASCVIIGKPAWGFEDSWSTKASMRVARSHLGVAEVNGKIYAVGGYNGKVLGTNEEYDPTTDTWISKTPMPTPRMDFGIAVFQNKIYCIGGQNSNGAIGVNEVYDPTTDTWEIRVPMPNARWGLKANVVRGKIYLIGGQSQGNPRMRLVRNDTSLNEVYDPTTDSWNTKTPMPNAATDYVSAVVDDKIYIIGGLGSSVSGILYLNQVYNAKTDTWSSASPDFIILNAAVAGATTGVNAPKLIYVIGGYYGQTTDFDEPYKRMNQIYIPRNDSWALCTPMPIDNWGYAVAVVDDLLYAIGGANINNNIYYAHNLQYTPVGYGTPDPSYVPPLNDSTAPEIAVLSPENQTYYTTDIQLNLIVNEPDCWISYELDGQTVGAFTGNASLTSLPQGMHTLTVYATDAAGNTGTSMTIYFTVTPIPSWLIIAVVLVAVAAIIIGLAVYRKRKITKKR
jgi:N-acetylneuraminic acid mutarotase